MELQPHIIEKYNVPVPRYTSYPPANYFAPISQQEYIAAVDGSNTAADSNLSFYFHIPFCHHICHYCACNSYPRRSLETIDRYVKALHSEIELLLPHIERGRKIAQIHYGGGTPTILPPTVIKELNDHLTGTFATIDNPEIAIECHPGFLSLGDWAGLMDAGFTRLSIGMQDLDTHVLKTVNRQPSLESIDDIFVLLKRRGAKINLDFLYGLSGQSVSSFATSIEKAISLAPDRLVTFSYAHVPWLKPQQKLLEKAGLPATEQKEQIFETAAGMLMNAGYKRVGMDHFVLPTDELFTATQQHQLHRNFQGYCTRRTTAQVYAIGVTGISQMETAYAQNTKDIDEYMQTVESGQLPIKKGYTLNRREQLTRQAEESLMCNYRIDWNETASHMHVSPAELKQATALTVHKMEEMAKDGIIEYDENALWVTEAGLPFVRNVAAALDPLMINTTKSFSKPI